MQNQEYLELLSGLSDSDGEKRKAAEELYNTIPAQTRFTLLGATLCHKQLPEQVRVFAAVLLRRLILSSWQDIQAAIPQQQLLPSCNELLNVLRQSSSETKEIRAKMCQVIATLAKCYLNETSHLNEWRDFIQFMFELLGSPQVELREAGLIIFSSNPEVFGQDNYRTAYIETLHPLFLESFQLKGQANSFYIALVAAVSGLIISNSGNKDCIKKLSTFSAPLIDLFTNIPDEATKEEICQHLIEVAEEAPLSLRPTITQIMQVGIQILTENDGLESDLRLSALELLVSLIENAPQMIKKRAPNFIKPFILRILALMSTIDDDPEWYTACTNDKDDDEPDAIGESALDRVANALGGKVLLPILLPELTAMLSKPEWQARHAALMAFSCSGEGCHDQLMKVLDTIVNGIINYLADPHPRVRHAACNAIGQMATDFSPEFENKFHDKIIPGLCRLIVDFSTMRVQAHSACAMINFFEECSQDVLATYLDPITEHIQIALSTLMNQGLPKEETKLFVIENIIVALSSVADSSAESFIKYYEKFMPCLKFIIKESTGQEDLRLLRGKAIECVSLIGMAVGKEKFCADANDIMTMLFATQTGEVKLSDDDPQLSYMMAAWARICRILGPEFRTYLPYVMEPVLKAASLKVEITLLNDEDKAAIENNSDWESVSVQDQAVGIRTAGLEDKATACSMLVCYARELKQDFVDYVERTAEVLIPLLKFPFNDDVRCAAAEAMPYLLECAKPKGEQFVNNLWNSIFENLIAAFDLETDGSITNQLMESIASSIEIIGPTSVTFDIFNKITLKLNLKLKQHFEQLAEEHERRKDEDYDNDSEYSCDEDEENEFLSGIASVIHSLFVVYKGGYLIYFQQHLDYILKLSVQDKSIPWSNRQTALCIWDDVIEYAGKDGLNYQKFFLPLLTNGILDKNKEVRQAALYGIGQLAQQNGEIFLEYFNSIIPNIVQMINHPEARKEDYIMATENGISAVGRILKYCPQLQNYDDLMKCWVNWLPIWEDDAEVPVVMGYLLQLIEQNNAVVMGPNSSNLSRLVAIVAEVFARSVIELNTEIGMKLINFLKQVHANPSVNSCLSTLTIEQQKAVQEVIAK